jgi:hypothetical protein
MSEASSSLLFITLAGLVMRSSTATERLEALLLGTFQNKHVVDIAVELGQTTGQSHVRALCVVKRRQRTVL